jgi:hypothetical protein
VHETRGAGGEVAAAANGALPRAPRRGARLLQPDHRHRHAARGLLCLETTTNDVSAFKHYRKVEHRQGPATRALAPVRKTIYSLMDLREILLGCNHRYLKYLSSLDDFSAVIRALDRLTQPRRGTARNLKASIFSAASNRACSRPCSVPASTSPACAAPTCGRCSPNALPPPSPDDLPVCANSASSNASLASTTTTSPAPDGRHSCRPPTSQNKPSFLLSPDKSVQDANTEVVSD